MTISKDQRLLYTGSCDKTISVFDINTKMKIDSLDFIHSSNDKFSECLLNADI